MSATRGTIAAMEPIFLVVGGPAVGKSTTSHALAASFPRGVHIPVDDLRHMVVSGYRLPGPDWSDELVRQIRLAREAAMRMALDHAAAGFAVVLDDFWDPLGLAEYRTFLEGRGTHKVVLYPTADEARRRNRARSGDRDGSYIDEAISVAQQILAPVVEHLPQEGWLVLDTTDLDVEASVAAILEHAQLRA
jgi:predicted kinase